MLPFLLLTFIFYFLYLAIKLTHLYKINFANFRLYYKDLFGINYPLALPIGNENIKYLIMFYVYWLMPFGLLRLKNLPKAFGYLMVFES